jgi:ribosome-associated protein
VKNVAFIADDLQLILCKPRLKLGLFRTKSHLVNHQALHNVSYNSLGAVHYALATMLQITPSIALDDDEITIDFIQASGPGGQNVNKVASAVQLRFDVLHSPALPDEIRARLLHLGGKRITNDGVLVIVARRHRTQAQNRIDALDQLAELIRKAAIKPRPRHKTTPTRAAKQERLRRKQERGTTKRLRRPIRDDE